MLYLKLGLGLVCLLLVMDLYILIHRWMPQLPPLVVGIGLLLLVAPCITFHTIWPAFYMHFLFFLLLTQLIVFCLHRSMHPLLLVLPLTLTLSVLGFGLYNIRHIQKTEYTITTSKPIPDTRIVMISDLHYPTGLDKKSIQHMMQILKEEQPSFYVLNGDMVDEFTTLSQMKTLCHTLKELTQVAPVYYVFGNHDNQHYASRPAFSKAELAQELRKNNIHVLQDQVVKMNGIFLIGREDEEVQNRIPLTNLLAQCDDKNYTIVLDHQPVDLDLCVKAGVDLQISGHTHAGQIFPLGWLAEQSGAVEHSYGFLQKGDFTQITSSGINGWGFPLRTQGKSEYVKILLTSD